MAYIGGAGYFHRAVLGAIVITWLQSGLSELHVGVAALPRAVLYCDDPVRADGPGRPDRMHRASPRHGAPSPACRPSYGVALVPLALIAAGAVLADRDELSPGDAARARHAHALLWTPLDAAVAMAVARRRGRACRRRRSARFTWRVVAAAWDARAPRRRGHDSGSRRASSATRCARPTGVPALALRGVEKRFGATRDHPRRVAGRRRAASGTRSSARTARANRRCSTSISGRFAPTRGSIRLDGEEIAGARPYVEIAGAVSRGASRSRTSFRGCRFSRTCAAACSGRSAIATASGATSMRSRDAARPCARRRSTRSGSRPGATCPPAC